MPRYEHKSSCHPCHNVQVTSRYPTLMKVGVLVVGVILLILGIAGAAYGSYNLSQMSGVHQAYCTGLSRILVERECQDLERTMGLMQVITGVCGLFLILGFALLIIGLVSKTPTPGLFTPPPQYGPPAQNPWAAQGQPCPTCGNPLRWVAESSRWWCDRERRYL